MKIILRTYPEQRPTKKVTIAEIQCNVCGAITRAESSRTIHSLSTCCQSCINQFGRKFAKAHRGPVKRKTAKS